MSTRISANKDHTSLVYQCNNVHTKKISACCKKLLDHFQKFQL